MGIDAGKIIAYLDMDTTGFTHAFDTASEQLSGFADGGIEGALGSIGAAATTTGRALTLGITTPLLTAAGAAVSVGMGFDESMSNVYGLMSSLNLSQGQMDALRDTAREMGATTKFSASEAADAMGYMALAGWDDQQVIAGLPGVLNLAAAANMDLARASDIVTDTMTPFGMAAEEAGRAANVFAYAQANSNTTVEALGEAMKYVAPSADAFGMTLEDTSAALGVLANAGIKGSQAGTTLNAMLRDMKKNADNGRIAIGKTKVALTNSDGSYRSYAEIVRDISNATKGMSESQRDAALSAVFGDESLKGILATLKQGPDALDEMTDSLYACEGAAEGMAAIMQDNLKGELTTLSSGIQEMGIALSDFLTPILREGVSFVTDLVGKFNSLNTSTKNTIFRLGTMTAAAGPMLLIGGKLITMLSGVAVPMAAVGAALTAAYRIFPEFASTMDAGLDTVRAFGEHLLNGEEIAQAFGTALEIGFGSVSAQRIRSFAEKAGSSIKTFSGMVAQSAESLGLALADEADKITLDWQENGVIGVLSGIGERMSQRIGESIPKVQEAAQGIRTAIADGIHTSAEWFAPRAQAMMGNLGAAISQAKEYATQKLPEVQDAIANGLQIAKTTLASKAAEAMTWLGEAYRSEEVQGLLGDLSGVADVVTQKISVTKAALIRKAGELLVSLGEALGSDEAKAQLKEITGVAAAIAGRVTSNVGAWQTAAASMIGDLVTQLTDNGFLVELIGNSASGLGGIVTAVAGGISNAAVNITTAASDIIGKLVGAMTANDGQMVGELFTNAGDVVGAIGRKIIEGAGQITIVAQGLATQILTDLNSMDWKAIGDAAGSALGDIAGNLLDALCSEAPKIAENAGPLVEAIGAGIANSGEALGHAAGGLVSGIVTWLLVPENWQRLMTAGESLGTAILYGMQNIVGGISEAALSIVQEISAAIAGPVAEAFGFDIEQSIGQQLAGINLGASPTTLAELQSAFTSYGDAIRQGIADQYNRAAWLANESVVGLYSLLIDTTANETQRAEAFAALVMSGYGDIIANEILLGSPSVVNAAMSMMDGSNKAVNDAVASLGGEIPGAISQGLESGIPILEEASRRVAEIASGAKAQADTVSDAQGVAQDVTDGVSAKLDEGAPDVETSAQGVSDAVTDTMDPLPGYMEALSTNGVLGMAGAVDTNKGKVSGAMDGMADDAMRAAASRMSASDGYEIGKNMVDGIVSGVVAGGSSLLSAMESLARRAVARAKSALRINSPSGVMADEVGAWIPGGIGVGVTRNMEDALGPLDEVRRSMVGLFDGALSGVALGNPQIPWSPQGAGGGQTTVNININGDWTVRSDEDRDAIIDELYERISDETRRR